MQKESSREVEPGRGSNIYMIRSFTHPSVLYRVDIEALTCTCGRFVHRGVCQKHKTLAFALAEIDRLVREGRLRFGKEAARDDVTRLVRKMYRKMTPAESYRVLTSVLTSPYATRAMRNTCQRRHLALVSGIAA